MVRVELGPCDLRGVPDAMRASLNAEASRGLVGEVGRWLNEDGGFVITPRLGVLFAKGADDVGADPPYPTAVHARGVHACGVEAGWLAEGARASMRAHASEGGGTVRCQGNVCCYRARGEFDSAGGIVFAPRPSGSFRIRAVYDVADNGTMGSEFISEQYRVTHDHLDRLRGRICPGEPSSPGG
ncbi:MAG: hypothetical protein AB8I08_33590 [Sandaracinaceae bacterium]